MINRLENQQMKSNSEARVQFRISSQQQSCPSLFSNIPSQHLRRAAMAAHPVRFAIACQDRADGRRRLVALFSGKLHDGIEGFWKDTVARMEAGEPLPQFKEEFGLKDITISTYGANLADSATEWSAPWKLLHDTYANDTPLEISAEAYYETKAVLEGQPTMTVRTRYFAEHIEYDGIVKSLNLECRKG